MYEGDLSVLFAPLLLPAYHTPPQLHNLLKGLRVKL